MKTHWGGHEKSQADEPQTLPDSILSPLILGESGFKIIHCESFNLLIRMLGLVLGGQGMLFGRLNTTQDKQQVDSEITAFQPPHSR